jgi:CCR4-NOT transcription complex subunit 3
MEKFKAVEKAMKTKAYSKEGLSAAAKLDPKERAKLEACEFLSNMVDELERQIETLEAEGKNQNSKADRMAEIERITERHKWHQGKLELIKRSLENGALETEQVTDLEESIKYYVSDGMNEDFMEDEEIYDELNLAEEEDVYGMNNDNDRVSSQDTQSIQEEVADGDARPVTLPGTKPKPPATTDGATVAARRPSTQLKSPLPALATLHTPITSVSNGTSSNSMKPAAMPTRPPDMKYASAAAAAPSVGIAPLPPPPGTTPPSNANLPLAPLPAPPRPGQDSPIPSHVQPGSNHHTPAIRPSVPVAAQVSETSSVPPSKSPAQNQQSSATTTSSSNSVPPTPVIEKADSAKPGQSRAVPSKLTAQPSSAESSTGTWLLMSVSFDMTNMNLQQRPKGQMVSQMASKTWLLKKRRSLFSIFHRTSKSS